MNYILVKVGRHKYMVRIHPHGLCDTTIDGRTYSRSKLSKLIVDLEKKEQMGLPTRLIVR